MRQWAVDPRILCRQHLMGEHNEHHMFVGSLHRKISINGYIENNLIEPLTLKSRHNELANEMKKREYNHNSPLEFDIEDLDYLPKKIREYELDRDRSFQDLISRCFHCRQRYRKLLIKYISKEPQFELEYQNLLNSIVWR